MVLVDILAVPVALVDQEDHLEVREGNRAVQADNPEVLEEVGQVVLVEERKALMEHQEVEAVLVVEDPVL